MKSGFMKLTRLKKSIISNAYGQLLTFVFSIFSIPIFLHFWGVEKYGVWLMLFTIPSYIASLDFGIGTTSTNNLIISKSSNNIDYHNEIFQTALLSISIINVLLFAVGGAFVVYFFRFTTYDFDFVFSGFVLYLYATISLYNSLFDSVYKYNDLFSEAVLILNSIRLVEWLIAIIFLQILPTFTAFSLGLFLGRIMSYFFLFLYCRQKLPILIWGFKYASKKEFRNILKPSVSFSVFPLANAINLQGTVLFIGYFFGSQYVSIFGAYRTLCRSVVQMFSLINKSYWPEFSELYGKKAFDKLSVCLKKSVFVNVSLSAIASIAMLFLGEKIINTWTHSKIEYDFYLLMPLVVSVLLTGFWQVKWVFLMAINKHQHIATRYFYSSAISLFVFIGASACANIYTALWSLIIFDVLLLYFSSKNVSFVLNDF